MIWFVSALSNGLGAIFYFGLYQELQKIALRSKKTTKVLLKTEFCGWWVATGAGHSGICQRTRVVPCIYYTD